MSVPRADASPSSDPGSPTQTTPGGAVSASSGGGPSLAPDTVLAGRFRIVRYLARGGMGEVYEASDLELREDVALKTVRREIADDPQALERFRNEIHLARKVTHPNACRIFDVFHHRADGDHDTVFLTMELLRGETLDARLRRTGPADARGHAGPGRADGRGPRGRPPRRRRSTATSRPATSSWCARPAGRAASARW